MDILAAFSRHCSAKRSRMPPSSLPASSSMHPPSNGLASTAVGIDSKSSLRWSILAGDATEPASSRRGSTSPSRLRVVDSVSLLRLQWEEREEVQEELAAAAGASGPPPGEGLDGMEMLALMLELLAERCGRSHAAAREHVRVEMKLYPATWP